MAYCVCKTSICCFLTDQNLQQDHAPVHIQHFHGGADGGSDLQPGGHRYQPAHVVLLPLSQPVGHASPGREAAHCCYCCSSSCCFHHSPLDTYWSQPHQAPEPRLSRTGNQTRWWQRIYSCFTGGIGLLLLLLLRLQIIATNINLTQRLHTLTLIHKRQCFVLLVFIWCPLLPPCCCVAVLLNCVLTSHHSSTSPLNYCRLCSATRCLCITMNIARLFHPPLAAWWGDTLCVKRKLCEGWECSVGCCRLGEFTANEYSQLQTCDPHAMLSGYMYLWLLPVKKT